jgi:hypothetical protein
VTKIVLGRERFVLQGELKTTKPITVLTAMRKALVEIFSLILLSTAIVGMYTAEVTKANFMPVAQLTIISPKNGETVHSQSPQLSVQVIFSFSLSNWIGYTVDGGKYLITLLQDTPDTYVSVGENIHALSNGYHTVDVYANPWGGATNEHPSTHVSVSFYVDAHPPIVSNLSINNGTYPSNVPLIFNVEGDFLYLDSYVDNRMRRITGNTTLKGLKDGSHNITVCCTDEYGNTDTTKVVHFTVDSIPPTISKLSVENKTYQLSELPLYFLVNETSSQLSYSLDDQTNTTIAGNTTLANLTNGSHSLVIYACDTVGNVGKSDPVVFAIDIPTPSSPPPTQPPTATLTPTSTLQVPFVDPQNNGSAYLLVGIIILVIVIAICLAIYFGKYRKKSN